MRHFLVAIVFLGGLQVSIGSVSPGSAFAQASSPTGGASNRPAAPAKPVTPAKASPNRETRPKDTAAKGAPAKATQAQRPSPQRPTQQTAARPAPKSGQPVVRKNTPSGSNAQKAAAAQKKQVVRDPGNVMSAGTRLGLRSALSDVALNSSAVIVIDQISGEVLIEKNPDAVLPIASITKLMTALVVLDAGLPLEELITITKEDADLEKNPVSRLPVGAHFTRGELMHLSLMSSENRAAHALGRTYPGGMRAFVAAMNIKALKIGMTQARFTEPTGLNNGNVASPRDLVRLVEESYLVPEIREYSTSRDLMVRVRGRPVQFMNSNALARGEGWDLGVSKTGFIRDAGRCLVMQADFESRPVIMVMLDAQGKQHRERDAQRIREFILQQAGGGRPTGGA
jgi:D-alanyl-D-alanine endopeptidase (penicillin-binding protein 7)